MPSFVVAFVRLCVRVARMRASVTPSALAADRNHTAVKFYIYYLPSMYFFPSVGVLSTASTPKVGPESRSTSKREYMLSSLDHFRERLTLG